MRCRGVIDFGFWPMRIAASLGAMTVQPQPTRPTIACQRGVAHACPTARYAKRVAAIRKRTKPPSQPCNRCCRNYLRKRRAPKLSTPSGTRPSTIQNGFGVARST